MKSVFYVVAFSACLNSVAADPTELRAEYDHESPARVAAAARAIEALGFVDADAVHGYVADQDEVLARYAHLDPRRLIASDLLARAVLYYDLNRERFPNRGHFVVVDFTPRSTRIRFFVVDVESGVVEAYHTTHGLNSDRRPRDGFAESFGNVVNSGKSSLGPARTGEVYFGKFKRSLRLDGLAASNSKLRARAVVVHGWDKVKEADVVQGLSWGCLTLDWSVRDDVIDKIKDGALVFVDQSASSSNGRKAGVSKKKHTP